jgi:hypothetical protein
MTYFKDELDKSPGYQVLRMSDAELRCIRNLVKEQYLGKILEKHPSSSKKLYEADMSSYHEFSNAFDHRNLWPKKARILGPNALDIVKSLPFYKSLCASAKISKITGEEGSGWEEMYWRIVRPGSSDIGSFHADKWFWDMGHGESISGFRRIKIWIAIETVPGKSGLRIIPNSHLRNDWRYHGEKDHTGVSKPKFDEDLSQLEIHNISTCPGEFIVFHDELIHAGMPNLSDETRVSLEATLLIED